MRYNKVMEEHKKQSDDEISRLIATDRWLLNSGLVTDSVQQNLLAYGYLSSEKVKNVEVSLDVKEKKIGYKIYLSKSNYRRYLRFRKRLEKKKPTIPLMQKLDFLMCLKILDLYHWITRGEKIGGFSNRLLLLAGGIGAALYYHQQFLPHAGIAAAIVGFLILYSRHVVSVGISDIRINIEGNLKKMVRDYIPNYELTLEVIPK